MRLTRTCARAGIGALLLGLLAACAGAPDAPLAPRAAALPPLPAADTCGAAPHAGLLGQPGVALERTLILREVRILRGDAVASSPLRPQRINFHLQDVPLPEGARPTRNATRIVAISCG